MASTPAMTATSWGGAARNSEWMAARRVLRVAALLPPQLAADERQDKLPTVAVGGDHGTAGFHWTISRRGQFPLGGGNSASSNSQAVQPTSRKMQASPVPIVSGISP
jgi:hypothetical protein